MIPSVNQQNVYDFITHGKGSAIVEAVAGSGKTFTIVNALDLIDPILSIAFLAFNKSIADELKKKVPSYVQAMTMNGMGHRAVTKRFGRFLKLDGRKIRNIARQSMAGIDFQDHGDEICKLVSLAKAHGIAPSTMSQYTSLMPDSMETWKMLIDKFDVDVKSTDIAYVIPFVRMVLQASIMDSNTIDFDDQLYLPVIMNMPLQQYDWLFVDEAQDVSVIQRALIRKALKPNGRLVAVGDRNQAIYGFRGADSSSLDNIAKDFNAVTLPLSISYRCPKQVVMYAKEIVPQIESAETAPDGEVLSYPSYSHEDFESQDMVVCRNTAPLIKLAYKLISRGVPVKVLGREIGTGLVKLIDKLRPKGIAGLRDNLYKWKSGETEKLLAKGEEDRIQGIEDRYDTLMTFIEDSSAKTVPDLKRIISDMFNSKGHKLTLCTIHKSKGLEANRVFILEPDLMPSKWARQEWQKEQEANLQYVAYTRAKESLIFIQVDDFNAENRQKAIA